MSAKDQATNREQKIVIKESSGLSDDEIQRMMQEAEQNAEDDTRKREEAELRNSASQLAYSAHKMLNEQGEQIPEDLKTEVQTQADALQQAAPAEDPAKLRTMIDELSATLQRVGQAVYERAGASSDGAPDGETPDAAPDDTVEGEFREV